MAPSPSSTPSPTRRTQAERTEATRTKLLDATLECLAEVGYAGTTTTEVSRRAGVSRGAQLHHFPTRAELVTAAARHVLEARVEEVEVALAAMPEGPERTQSVIDLLWGIFQGPTTEAWVELVIGGRSDPELAELVAEIAEELDEVVWRLWGELFPTGIGSFVDEISDAIPALLFAVLDGLTVRRMTGAANATERSEQVIQLMKLLAAYFEANAPG